MRWACTVLIFLIGTVWCQNEIPEDLEKISYKLNEVPGFENLNESDIPSIRDVQDTLKQKCEENGGAEAFEKLGDAKDRFQECIQSNFNFTQIQEELRSSRKRGSMDEVFAKHCSKRPVLQECIRNAAIAFEPCVNQEEKSSLQLLLNITDSVISFTCYKDGDRISMFIAEGGFECLQSKREGLEECLNKTFGHQIPTDPSVNNMSLLVITKETCNDYTNLRNCVVRTLKTCENPAPANFVDTLLKYIYQMTPCKSYATSATETHLRVLRSYNQEELNALNDMLRQVNQKYEPRCLENGGQIAADEFRETLEQVKNCSNLMHSNLITKVREAQRISFSYICRDFRLGIRACLTTLSAKMAACSSPEEAYAPKYGIDLYDSIFNFYCKDDARALKKFLKEKDVCMNKIHKSTRFCLNKTKHIEMYTKDAVVTKSELCSDLKSLRNCFLDVAGQQCPHNAIASEFVVGLSDAMYKPCAGCKISIPNFIMFLFFMLKVF